MMHLYNNCLQRPAVVELPSELQSTVVPSYRGACNYDTPFEFGVHNSCVWTLPLTNTIRCCCYYYIQNHALPHSTQHTIWYCTNHTQYYYYDIKIQRAYTHSCCVIGILSGVVHICPLQ